MKDKGSSPDFHIFAKGLDGYYIRIGAGWERRKQNGEAFISLSISALPFSWTGHCVLHPAKETPSDDAPF